MSLETQDKLEAGLQRLTDWGGKAPGLWTGALERTRAKRPARPISIWLRRVPAWALGSVAAAVVLFVGTMAYMPVLKRGIPTANKLDALDRAIEGFDADREKAADSEAARWKSIGPADEERRAYKDGAVAYGYPGYRNAGAGGRLQAIGGLQSNPSVAASQPAEDAGERFVVRKATLDLAVDDVAAAFLKAQQLASEAGGEFVQDSTLKGTGRQAEGNLTLRVAADRLHAVLNDLRKLGKVNSENVNGEDVTTQVVDTDARLKNERRVEEELLKLFDQKQNSPLTEVLQLRDKLSSVRQTIEQLTAQREKLGRLVSLATILVIIRPADAPPPKVETLWQHFGERMTTGLRNGVLFLMDSLAGLLGFLVGGLMWWVMAAIVGLLVWRGVAKKVSAGA